MKIEKVVLHLNLEEVKRGGVVRMSDSGVVSLSLAWSSFWTIGVRGE